MKELEVLGSEQIKKTYISHGGREPVFGVKAGDMSKLIKQYKLKNNHKLAIDLYATGNYDAMYLAGLIADADKITKETVMLWLSQAYCWMHAEYTVGSVASETPFAMELVSELVNDCNELYASCGYSILSFYVAFVLDEALNKNELRSFLHKIESKIHSSPNRVRYQMNGAVWAIGTSVPDLFEEAYVVGERIGKVSVDMDTAGCKVPSITEKLQKAKEANRIGFKRKSSRC
jgi:3-methyladenine DNA glycosylase AlkD